jgi:predicted Ser/Thr protein kinase
MASEAERPMATQPAGDAGEGGTYVAEGTLLHERYEIGREIGRGGHSVVYLARDRSRDRTGDSREATDGSPDSAGSTGASDANDASEVAIKLLVPPPALAHVARERMRREAHAVRTLTHVNIVTLHEYFEDAGRSFLVMEYVDGPTLFERVRKRGPLTEDEAVKIAIDLASALREAHRRGILHRDVKPRNVLLDRDGRAKLTDFGSARLDGQASMTMTGGLVGTLAYAAPELMAGVRGDARSDLYSLGLTIYFALTGELPDRASRSLPPAPSLIGYTPRSAKPEVSTWLDGVVSRCTRAEPGRRYPTAGALVEALLAARIALESQEEAPAALLEAEAGAPPACDVCGTLDPLGLGGCVACGASEGADALLFLARAPRRVERRLIEEWVVSSLQGAVGRYAVREVAEGERPLVRLPREMADRAVLALTTRGVGAARVTEARAWRRLPLAFGVLLFLVVLSGLAAGFSIAPPMMFVTPVFAGLLALTAVRRVTRPAWVPGEAPALDLPPDAEIDVRETLARLDDGPARRLLRDVTRLASGLHLREEYAGRDDFAGTLGELLGWSARAASDLARLDDSLAVLEERATAEEPDSRMLEAATCAGRARDGLVQRLLEAIAGLGRVRTAWADADLELGPLGERLESEARLHAEATSEVQALLR